MMWNYLRLSDDTQIAYSDIRDDGTVLIGIERPRDWGFDSARCVMPAYRWSDVEGFSQAEIDDLESLLKDNAPFIFELAERPSDERRIA